MVICNACLHFVQHAMAQRSETRQPSETSHACNRLRKRCAFLKVNDMTSVIRLKDLVGTGYSEVDFTK